MHYLSSEALQKYNIFSTAHPDSIETAIQKGKITTYRAGEHIFFDKDPLSYFYILLTGTAMLYKGNENGQTKVVFILGEGELLNEVIFEDLPSAINCKAYNHCIVLTLYKSDFINMMEKDFKLTQNVMNSLSKRVRRLYRQSKNATSVIKIEKKLAAKLWKLGKDYGIPHEDGLLIDFAITITALAELLGSYRETISRALKLLIERDLIIYKEKKIIIKNPDELASFFKTS